MNKALSLSLSLVDQSCLCGLRSIAQSSIKATKECEHRQRARQILLARARVHDFFGPPCGTHCCCMHEWRVYWQTQAGSAIVMRMSN